MQRQNKLKVALVAVASKEAAYLAEWVFHHLRFGFDPLLVLVNRSDDATERMLHQLNGLDPRVQVINVDFLDNGTPNSNSEIQSDAYDFGLAQLRQTLSSNDYMMCLDIDEFWTPLRFKGTISDFLRAENYPAKCSFNWFISCDEPNAFAPVFKALTRGKHHRLLKSGFQIGLKIKRIFPHHVNDESNAPVHVASGLELESPGFCTTEAPQDFADAIILHRLNRSVVEYLGLLGRTIAESADLPFKANRKGYGWVGQFVTHQQDLHLDAELLAEYYSDFEKFVQCHQLGDMILLGRRSVLDKGLAVIETFENMSPQDQKKWAHIFSNVDLDLMPIKIAQEREKLRGDKCASLTRP